MDFKYSIAFLFIYKYTQRIRSHSYEASVMLSTPAGGALIRASNGCTIFKNKYGTNLINSGPVSTEVLKCGTNPTSDYSTSENDLTTNTFCTLN